jgi:hypothetical protein
LIPKPKWGGGGDNEAKKRSLGETSKEDTKHHVDVPLISKTRLYVEHPHLKPLAKEKGKEIEPKGTPRILMPLGWQQISIGGMNPRGQTKPKLNKQPHHYAKT